MIDNTDYHHRADTLTKPLAAARGLARLATAFTNAVARPLAPSRRQTLSSAQARERARASRDACTDARVHPADVDARRTLARGSGDALVTMHVFGAGRR